MRRTATWRKVLGIAVLTVAGTLASEPLTTGAGQPCRVRNVTQDTTGRSLIGMVEEARDGDGLRVRGTCRGVIVIRADIAITGVGNRPTLTGRGHTRVVRVRKGARVTLRDLVITRGAHVVSGAGIANEGKLRLRDVIVERNRAVARWRQGALWGAGGGITNTGHLLLVDSTVRANRAKRSAGGIYNQRGRVILLRTTVTDNATITTQYDPYGGGGIHNYGRLRIVDSTISDNRTGDNGGGIYNNGRSRVTIIRSTLARNEGYGGGVQNEGTLIVRRSDLVDNMGWPGGAIVNYKRATLTDSTVSGNTGGAIFNWGWLTVLSTSITANASRATGGGIVNLRRARLIDSTIARNRAERGGGIFNQGRLTVLRTSITSNTGRRKGGGIFNERRATLTKTTIARNQAPRGGGIDNSGPLSLLGTSVTSNAATEAGGGIFNVEGTTVTLNRTSSVTGNSPDDCVGTPGC